MPRTLEAKIDLTADRERVLAMFDVSRETAARLDRFVALMLSWHNGVTFLSLTNITALSPRHVADSLQLLQLTNPHINPPVWLDLGSGGGFPGVAIACALADVPGACVHLVESNMKKAAF